MRTQILSVYFFKTLSGKEPVREWIKNLSAQERKTIGEDIKTVQFGWPLGMPLTRKLAKDLWEVRIHLEGRIARIMFTIENNVMVLLHGFIKKSQTTPQADIELAKERIKLIRSKL